ncbi:SMP-30/gluconolactonase/LRE family protein [Microvirga mediterraneensis]|uniref:SMP-30/gluconolactonase/LRE family protein n=1 Tax=Microvirga mediterraneensis TaxID=2754695 RepID=A0A838BSG0_9HYPH|nr:SMP-30/gluconolactonase/LRE family protein [Microvirga mediterraneensis]MBA1158371.1 SMP-30/gluconolactonase/LRE family protein [Microvirga mediterraneensis]
MSESEESPAARGTAALQKGLSILDALADGGGSMTFSEIGKATGLPKGTLHRILAALTDHGTIRFESKDSRYRFGWRLVEYARWSTAELDLKALAEPELIRLHALTGELVLFAVGERAQLICEQVISNPQSYPHGLAEGVRLPAYCTAAGKAMLAFTEPHRLDALIESTSFEALTPSTIEDRQTFRAQLDVTKARRYAIEDQEWQNGVRSVAAPVLDRANRPIGVIAIMGPAFRMSVERLHELGPDILRSAQRITGQAAFTQPSQSPKANMITQPSVSCVVRSNAFLGEGPFWSEKDKTLKWIDILAPAIHISDPAQGSDLVIPMPEIVGAFAECTAGGLVIASQTGFFLLDPTTGRKTPIGDPEIDKPGNRFNDGKCDSRGRFWAGTMDMAVTPGAGSLYRLDAHGRIDKMESGIGISNGLGWSPDDRLMYFTDSMARTIFVYDFDPDRGTISHRRVFAQTPENMGVPDGLTVDAEGFVWSAQWDGWRIIRYAPDGTVDRTISVPVPRPTSCTFGGPDLSTLYITSARIRLSSQQLQEAPLSGSVFALDAGVRGLPDHSFKWSRS